MITSLFFSLMHFQYYNILDQSVLFVVSMLLLVVRIQSKSLFYSMLIHSGMNAFVILLNTQKMI
ncbi:type II CAAX prenyl endopeptidase Rce1 family protein [Citrobacter braakii]|uniref:CPBP family glutamic-type intramembrane protease n=1 Tax=Citrobacter braakii TaxID=57706 RepID=UPI00351D9114